MVRASEGADVLAAPGVDPGDDVMQKLGLCDHLLKTPVDSPMMASWWPSAMIGSLFVPFRWRPPTTPCRRRRSRKCGARRRPPPEPPPGRTWGLGLEAVRAAPEGDVTVVRVLDDLQQADRVPGSRLTFQTGISSKRCPLASSRAARQFGTPLDRLAGDASVDVLGVTVLSLLFLA